MKLSKEQLTELLDLFVPYYKARCYYILCMQHSVDIHIPQHAIQSAEKEMKQTWKHLKKLLKDLKIHKVEGDDIQLPEPASTDNSNLQDLRSWLHYNEHQKDGARDYYEDYKS